MIILNPTCLRLQFFMEASAASQSFPCKIWELLVDAFNKRRQTEVTNLSCTWEVLTSCQMSNSSTSIRKSNFTERAARFIMLARLPTCYRRRQFFAKQLDLYQFFLQVLHHPSRLCSDWGSKGAATKSRCIWLFVQPLAAGDLLSALRTHHLHLMLTLDPCQVHPVNWRHPTTWSHELELFSSWESECVQMPDTTVPKPYQIHSNHFNSTLTISGEKEAPVTFVAGGLRPAQQLIFSHHLWQRWQWSSGAVSTHCVNTCGSCALV